MYHCNFCQRCKFLKITNHNKCSKCNYESAHLVGENCCQCYGYGTIVPKNYIPGSLIHAVKAFKEDYKDRWITYLESVGACAPVAYKFRNLCHAMKINCEARDYNVSYNGHSQFYHAYNYAHGIIIDWTHRQFDHNCKIPLISSPSKYPYFKESINKWGSI